MTVFLIQIAAAAAIMLLLHYTIPGARKMNLYLYVALILLLIVVLAVLISIRMFRIEKPPNQKVRDITRVNNLFLCVDCAGHHGSHQSWCGLPRPDGFLDVREVRPPVVDPDAIRPTRVRKRVRVTA